VASGGNYNGEVLYMKRNPMALAVTLALMLACGERTSERDAGTARAGVEDTTAAPSTDLGVPSRDTAADTGSATGTGGRPR
jgi:hypothetical protein